MRLPYPEGYSGTLAEFVNDIFIAIGLALHTHGHSQPASQLIAAHAGASRFARSRHFSAELTSILVAGNRISDAILLVQQLFGDEGTWEQAFAAYHAIAPALFTNEVSIADKIDAANILASIAKSMVNKEPLQSATIYYNAANLYRGLNEYRNAIAMYHRALNAWREYAERSYFCEELAGVLYESRRFRASSELYRRAREIEESDGLRGRHGDALLFSGNYEEAANTLKGCGGDAEWILKYKCTKYIIDQTGLSQQCRDPITARKQDDPNKALQLDALDPRAWWNIAFSHVEAGEYSAASIGYLISAFSSRVDREAWLNALACAHKAGDIEIHVAIVAVASQWFGQEFLIDYFSRIEGREDK